MYTKALIGDKPRSASDAVDFTSAGVRPALSGGVPSEQLAFGRGQHTSGFLPGIEERWPVQFASRKGPTNTAARSYGHHNTRWP